MTPALRLAPAAVPDVATTVRVAGLIAPAELLARPGAPPPAEPWAPADPAVTRHAARTLALGDITDGRPSSVTTRRPSPVRVPCAWCSRRCHGVHRDADGDRQCAGCARAEGVDLDAARAEREARRREIRKSLAPVTRMIAEALGVDLYSLDPTPSADVQIVRRAKAYLGRHGWTARDGQWRRTQHAPGLGLLAAVRREVRR